ncbi:hypothetical protein [Methanosphaerula palustris]|uniref:hypothetical protein n=1 Tax=Methanosphaerula palustris TaxID=475088 RepID=UPI0011D14D01|nr:hypothetical protein [Methanosphaerula palustris]
MTISGIYSSLTFPLKPPTGRPDPVPYTPAERTVDAVVFVVRITLVAVDNRMEIAGTDHHASSSDTSWLPRPATERLDFVDTSAPGDQPVQSPRQWLMSGRDAGRGPDGNL